MNEQAYFGQFSGYQSNESLGYRFRLKSTGQVFTSLFSPDMEMRGWTFESWTLFQLLHDEAIHASKDDIEIVWGEYDHS